jgi:Tfp pilus assembly protein PilX
LVLALSFSSLILALFDMTTAQTFRPARRIPAARLALIRAASAAKAEAREAAWQASQDALEQLSNPTPEFEAAPRLTMLPGGLHWSNQAPVPAIGATVTVNRDGHKERAEVKGYTHAAGFLGLITETTHHAKGTSRRKRSSLRAGVVFGSQLALAA